MRKIIAAINMTLDGIGDHTAITPDEEIHQHYADLLGSADAILPKIVFSHTLQSTGWESATLATIPLHDEVMSLKQQAGGNIFVGSRSLIIQLLGLNLIDELQLCVHPMVAGSGRPLFENISRSKSFNLLRTKTFAGGAVLLYYVPAADPPLNQ